MAPGPFAVRDFADYVAGLREAKVILDGAERGRIDRMERADAGAAEGLELDDDPALLDEVTGWSSGRCRSWAHRRGVPGPAPRGPGPHHADEPEVFRRCATPDGRLAPHFVVVANIEANDGGEAIVAGNERVLRRGWTTRASSGTRTARRRSKRLEKLKHMIFHAKLGTHVRAGRAARGVGARSCSIGWGADPPRRSARRCWPRPTWSPAWWANSRSCRASWAATTPARRASYGRGGRDPRPIPAQGPTTSADRAGDRGRRPGRQAGHAGGLLRHRQKPPAPRTRSRCGARGSGSLA